MASGATRSLVGKRRVQTPRAAARSFVVCWCSEINRNSSVLNVLNVHLSVHINTASGKVEEMLKRSHHTDLITIPCFQVFEKTQSQLPLKWSYKDAIPSAECSWSLRHYKKSDYHRFRTLQHVSSVKPKHSCSCSPGYFMTDWKIGVPQGNCVNWRSGYQVLSNHNIWRW